MHRGLFSCLIRTRTNTNRLHKVGSTLSKISLCALASKLPPTGMKGPHSNDEPLVKAMDSCGHAFGHKVFLFEKLEVTASLRTILVHVCLMRECSLLIRQSSTVFS